MYTIVDEQSHSEFFDPFDVQNVFQPQSLVSCSGRSTCNGRRVHAIDSSYQFNIPTVIQCNDKSNNRQEMAKAYSHLRQQVNCTNLRGKRRFFSRLDVISEMYITFQIRGQAHHTHHIYAEKILRFYDWYILDNSINPRKIST